MATEKWLVVFRHSGRVPVGASVCGGYTRETAERIAARPYAVPRRAVPARVTTQTAE